MRARHDKRSHQRHDTGCDTYQSAIACMESAIGSMVCPRGLIYNVGEGPSVCRLTLNQNTLPPRTVDETVSDTLFASWHHCFRLRHFCAPEKRGQLATVHCAHGRRRYLHRCLDRVERLRDRRFTGAVARAAPEGVRMRSERPPRLVCSLQALA